jgi:hypothetical protein
MVAGTISQTHMMTAKIWKNQVTHGAIAVGTKNTRAPRRLLTYVAKLSKATQHGAQGTTGTCVSI